MLQPRSHTIRPGETLSSIAKAHRLAGWQALYYAQCNSDFRRANTNPDLIRPGGIIKIPPTPEEQRRDLDARLKLLANRRIETVKLFDEQERDLKQAIAQINRVSQNVDTAATLATLFVGLVSTTLKASKIMKLEGPALDQANKQFAREFATDHGKKMGGFVAQAVSDSRSNSQNTVWLVTRSVAQAWCDLSSPSFWASTYVNLKDGMSWSAAVTTKPDHMIRNELLPNLLSMRRKQLAEIDSQTHLITKELAALRHPNLR